MTHHHPDQNILTEFVAGSLNPAMAIAVRSHLHFCMECQQAAHNLENLGGSLLENLKPEPLANDSFASLMKAIDSQTCTDSHNSVPNVPSFQTKDRNLPKVLNKIINQSPVNWRKINRTLQTATLHTGHLDHEVSLQKIKAGGKAPEHDHKGTEITVVLEGSFSDENGIYHKGDFLLKNPGDIHQPVASRNQDCICLTVQDAPVKLTSWMGYFINPFLKLHTA